MTTNVSTSLKAIPQLKAGATVQAKAGDRLLFIDNLRIFLTILVVLHHLSITYGASGGWLYYERPTTQVAQIVLSLFTMLNHNYFMGFFFLISGYFVVASVDRKGTWLFIKDRLIRLGIPALIYGFLISPFPIYILARTEESYRNSLGTFVLDSWRNLDYYPGPLWFVEALLIFSIVYALGREAIRWLKRSQKSESR